jgi:hypothetical protein
MLYVSLFVFVFFIAATTMAEVKKEFGEFKITHVDKIKNQAVVQRHYSSRSLYKGYFGFNWCSSLDYKVTVAENAMSLFDCELGKRIEFKKTGPFRYENDRYQIKLSVTAIWIQLDRTDVKYFFSLDGKLSHWQIKNQEPIYIVYKNNQPQQLMSKKLGRLEISSPSAASGAAIQKIGAELMYEYDKGLLKKVSNTKKTLLHYQYDEFLNMTLWRSPSNFESMKYDSEWDRIVYLKDQDNCRTRFQYEVKQTRKYILESKKCINHKEKDTLFEMTGQQILVQTPSDQLGKEFRQGANNENTF